MELLDRIRSRAAEESDALDCLDAAAIERAEAMLGFRLPPLLAAVYREVGNGGFGADAELLSLTAATELYLTWRTKQAGTAWAWPEGVLPIVDWGCGMYACVDCRGENGTVLLFEPNPGDPEVAWFIDAPDLAGWFEHWINDTGWWVEADQADEMALWPFAAARA